jgi:gamma-glutamyltranspeptidase
VRPDRRQRVIARPPMIAAVNPHAIDAGYAILAKGAPAFDADISEDRI